MNRITRFVFSVINKLSKKKLNTPLNKEVTALTIIQIGIKGFKMFHKSQLKYHLVFGRVFGASLPVWDNRSN